MFWLNTTWLWFLKPEPVIYQPDPTRLYFYLVTYFSICSLVYFMNQTSDSIVKSQSIIYLIFLFIFMCSHDVTKHFRTTRWIYIDKKRNMFKTRITFYVYSFELFFQTLPIGQKSLYGNIVMDGTRFVWKKKTFRDV